MPRRSARRRAFSARSRLDGGRGARSSPAKGRARILPRRARSLFIVSSEIFGFRAAAANRISATSASGMRRSAPPSRASTSSLRSVRTLFAGVSPPVFRTTVTRARRRVLLAGIALEALLGDLAVLQLWIILGGQPESSQPFRIAALLVGFSQRKRASCRSWGSRARTSVISAALPGSRRRRRRRSARW